MPRIAVRFHPVAAQEAETAYAWYAARSVPVAEAFREELRHAVDAIGDRPDMWPRYGRRARRYVLPRYPFSLIYVRRTDEVEVIAVAHGKRRPGYWASRVGGAKP